METTNLILIEKCCSSLEVEFSFINSLNEYGLVDIIVLEDKKYISNEQLKDVERAIHFHHELNINMEGIDVIYNLLKQIDHLQEELRITKNKLNLFDLE
ncbi:MAG: MerR family transcriptional regulator [Flavobacteriales bacterium CG18_big_fil_WC_8_21_14_2_50_32_9]|nr:MAG: MerR family transcriptional regulator [Flavobacteriales bacterium CG18_big_fil_WC_8_21_14_2_50_32_9]